MAKHRKKYKLNRHRYSKNPFGKSTKDFASAIGFAIVGGIATRAIPENFLSNYNSGAIGYVMNGIVAFGGGYALGLTDMFGKEAGAGFALGGAVMLAGRIVSEVFGKTLVTFSYPFGAGTQPVAAALPAAAAGTAGLGRYGDPAFNLGSYVKPYPFSLPSANRSVASVASPAPKASVHSRTLARRQSVPIM